MATRRQTGKAGAARKASGQGKSGQARKPGQTGTARAAGQARPAGQATTAGQARTAGTAKGGDIAKTSDTAGASGATAGGGAEASGPVRANGTGRAGGPRTSGARAGGPRTSGARAGGPRAERTRASGARAGGPRAERTRANGARAEGTAEAAGSGQAVAEAQAAPLWRRAAAYPGGHKLEFTTLIASLLGLGVSVYLAIEHFTQATSLAGCPENATFNCLKVTTSAQSYVLGIPVAVLGLAFYVFMVAVNSPWGWRARQPAVHWARLGSLIIGMVFVLYLVYAELFLVKAICLYCTSVHVLTFLLFSLIVTRTVFSGVGQAPARR